MKIKLQDYALINNEWIEREINKAVETGETEGYMSGFVDALLMLKQELIPSEKLADICFKEGAEAIKKDVSFYGPNYVGIENDKYSFLNSEIELSLK